jgi:excisionase family DNA binding protein
VSAAAYGEHMAAPATYLSARAAAMRLGVSDKTVRTWVRSGRLNAAPTPQGFRIPTDEVEALAAERGAAPVRDSADAAASPHLADQLADLRAYVADLRTQLEVKDRQIGELHTLLAQAHRSLPPAHDLRPFVEPSANGTVEMTQRSSEARTGRSWWRFW